MTLGTDRSSWTRRYTLATTLALVFAALHACGLPTGTAGNPDAAVDLPDGRDSATPPADTGATHDVVALDVAVPTPDAGDELCGNGMDDDGDGQIDEGCPCLPGATQRCFTGPAGLAGLGACSGGTQTCEGSGEFGSWGACEGSVDPAPEACDGVDNDCDGTVDNGCACAPGATRACYTGPDGTAGVGTCGEGLQTCIAGTGNVGSAWGACTGETHPAHEACDGVDNDCDGTVDNGCTCTPGATRACYGGPAGTSGVGPCRGGTQTCTAHDGGVAEWSACAGQVLPASEVCDGADNDCNGMVDNGCGCTPGATRACYTGASGTQGVGLCRAGSQACVAGAGGVGSAWGACTGQTLPGAESCDDRDNNCDGTVDDGCVCRTGESQRCYDGPAGTSGVGACAAGSQPCTVTAGVARWGTCAGESLPHTEICDGIDNDCDGVVDEGCACRTGQTRGCYTGVAGTEGIGQCRGGSQACVVAGGMASWGACTGQVLPGSEACDAADNDCDGVVDDGCACMPGTNRGCFPSPTGTAGVGICRAGTQPCIAGAGNVGSAWGACTGFVGPAAEACDGVDNDCDGAVDDGCSCTPGTTRACYTGTAGTQGVGTCHGGTQSCVAGTGGVGSAWGACAGQVLPAGETCDGADNDCNGTVDNGCACTPGATRACYTGAAGTQGVGVCRAGAQPCVAGTGGIGSAWGACAGQVTPMREACSGGTDEDCNGRVDCADLACGGMSGCATCTAGGLRVTVERPADVLYLIDRSGSMTERTPDGSTRWTALRNAMTVVLPPLDASLSMGALIFPQNTADACSVPSGPQIPIQQPGSAPILAALASTTPEGSTPTLEALRAAEAYFASHSTTHRRYIVLATDGLPNCTGTEATVAAEITRLRTTFGVDTFVVGLSGGDASLIEPLNRFADAGGHPRAGTLHFYDVASTLDFEHALRGITAVATDCTYAVAPTPALSATVTVRLDSAPVSQDATNGWTFTDGTHDAIQFHGASCGQLTSGTVATIDAATSC